MKNLELRYVGHISMMTGCLKEACQTETATIRELLAELTVKYAEFQRVFVNPSTSKMNFNVMIYYAGEGKAPVSVIDVDHPIENGAKITFW